AGIRNLNLTAASQIKTDLLLANSTFHATSDLESTHTIKLGSDSFDLRSIKHLLPEDLNVTGQINALDLNAKLPKDAPREISLNLDAQNLKYQEYTVSNLSATGQLGGDDATLDLTTDFNIPDQLSGTFSAQATGTLAPEIQKSLANLNWKLTTKEYPELTGTAAWADEKANLTALTLDKVKLTADFDPASQTYTAEATSTLDDARVLLPELTSAKFSLNASGDLKNETHNGSLTLQDLRYTAKESPTIQAQGHASWDWPTQFSFKDLEVKRDDIELKTSLTWKEGFANFSKLLVADTQGSLITGQGSLPLPLQTRNLDDLLANKSPLDFSVNLAATPLSRFVKSKPIKGTAQATLDITGTFAKPFINGRISADKVSDPSLADIPPGDLAITITTKNEQLQLSGTLKEPSGDLLNLKGTFPLTPQKWIKNPDSLMEEPLSFSANTPQIDLRRIRRFVPSVSDLSGIAQINVSATGTINKPDLSGDAMIRADRARLSTSPISDFRNSVINLKFRDNVVTIPPSQITAAGGTIDFNGSVTLGETPLLDLSFKGDNTLLWRGSAYSLRADPILTLKGPFDTARLSGTIPIVESIVYKDVEILPFGIPTKEIERPEVPDLSFIAGDELYSLPEPFANWPIDIAVVTKDPVLIRGNLVKGELLADARLGGTLGKLTTSGKITSKDLKADLPFANLVIENGTVDLNPRNLVDPQVSIRGNSKVAGYEVQLYVTGPVSKPSLSITSEPPLPESEILMLLSTGSTTSTLNNRSVASQKALQYLLQGLRRRYGKQDAKSLLQRFLKNIDEVDLSLGDYNRFSGRHFTSATIDLNDQWAISASIDEEGNNRNMVIFSFRFR
ncbi:translocation/assembly module TamB domain-containing protein, partial [Akkermansiaceae bacterium]|nr:translocation/assembly module TamB domain-containing protein [Akkermansiaceae bacterium]